MLFERFARFHQADGAVRRMQGVIHPIVRLLRQLQLNAVMQPMASLRLHQAGVGGVDQCAEFAGRDAELAFAGRVYK
ncbi:hypothetical protein D3C80_1774820 [compost metagenome]